MTSLNLPRMFLQLFALILTQVYNYGKLREQWAFATSYWGGGDNSNRLFVGMHYIILFSLFLHSLFCLSFRLSVLVCVLCFVFVCLV